MESISSSPHIHLHHTNLIIFPHLSSPNPSIVIFPYRFSTLHSQRFCGLKTSRSGGGGGGGSSQQDGSGYGAADLLRKPAVEVKEEGVDGSEEEEDEDEGDGGKIKEEDGWIDWEDQILEDTVPLVGFVRMILHSGKYASGERSSPEHERTILERLLPYHPESEKKIGCGIRYASGERLSPEHQRTILERLLPYHPESEKKIGCGISYITVGYHPDFESSRCLFIVRKDGEMVDFSYWKCIKGLIRKNYPLYADSFILRHFRRRRHND